MCALSTWAVLTSDSYDISKTSIKFTHIIYIFSRKVTLKYWFASVYKPTMLAEVIFQSVFYSWLQ